MTKKELVEFGNSRGIPLNIKDKKEVILKELLANPIVELVEDTNEQEKLVLVNDDSEEYQTHNLEEEVEDNKPDTKAGSFKQLINIIWDYVGRLYVSLILIIGMSPLIFFFWIATQPGAESQCLPLGSMC